MNAMRLIGVCVALALAGPVYAAPEAAGQEQVLQRIILMRHGIRSPTKAPADLAKYSADPWPAWPVAPGQLTPHGIDTLHSLGQRMANDLSAVGLPGNACNGDVRVIADSTPRNRASAEALLQGLSPKCAPSYQALPAGQEDPLFRGTGGGDDEDKAGINAADIDGPTRDTLAELQRALLACTDAPCLTKARAEGKQVLLGGDMAKALKTAGSLAENIMLAYAQGMPDAQYGWGRLDAAGVARIIGLHNASFRLAHATPDASRGRGGNMLAHITATLAQAAGATPAVNALAPAKARVVVVIGHDTDLAAQAGLLGLDWHDATRGDDFPPGGALIYDLVKTKAGLAVRISVAMPTLAALRSGNLTPAASLTSKVVRPNGCTNKPACPWDQFSALSRELVADGSTPVAGDEPTVGQP